MIKGTAGFIVKHLHMDERLQKDQVEICQYGMEIILSTIANIISVLIIGYIGKGWLESIIFLISFSVLRQETGGFHAGSYLTCNLSLIVSYSLMLWLYKLTSNGLGIMGMVLVFGIHFLIWYFCMPVENENKPLSTEQKKTAKRRALILSSIYVALSLLCFLAGFYSGLMLVYTVALIDILALVSVIKRRIV